jgi:hypothetical protein
MFLTPYPLFLNVPQILNASCNLPIYLFVGKSFRTSFIKMFGLQDLVQAWEKSRGKLNTCGL